jgi:hypothetical protein
MALFKILHPNPWYSVSFLTFPLVDASWPASLTPTYLLCHQPKDRLPIPATIISLVITDSRSRLGYEKQRTYDQLRLIVKEARKAISN